MVQQPDQLQRIIASYSVKRKSFLDLSSLAVLSFLLHSLLLFFIYQNCIQFIDCLHDVNLQEFLK